MKRKQITLVGAQALSSRNAAALVHVTSLYKSMIWIDEGTKHINAKSMMGILSLKLMKGSTFEVIVVGPDEEAAIQATTDFIRDLPS